MNKKLEIAIDASRNRSGGAIRHIIEILNNFDHKKYPNFRIHVWTYDSLKNQIHQNKNILIHTHKLLNMNIFFQTFWQIFLFPIYLKKNNCSFLFNCDAGSLNFLNSDISMSRDMLSYEKKELKRFGISFKSLRLLMLFFIQNRTFNKSKHIIFLSEYARDTITPFLKNPKKNRVIPHGISKIFRSSQPTTWNYQDLKFIEIAYVSNINWYKHQWNVVVAAKNLVDKGYRLKLNLIGDCSGNACKFLHKYLSLYDPNLDFVKLHGHLNDTAQSKILSQSHLYVYASSCENLPNTLLEAMSSGLTIVSSNKGPMTEILKNSAFYFNPESPEEISNQIENAINDKDLRDKKTLTSFELSQKYSWKKCSLETFSYISDILKEKNE